MAKYLKLFEQHSQYEAYINGQDAVLPNVSYCIDNDEVHYNNAGTYIEIVYKGNNAASATNIITKEINAFGDTYTLDESSITKMTLDEQEITFSEFTVVNAAQSYGATCNLYTYTFNDENEHSLKIWTTSSEMLRLSPWNSGPSPNPQYYFTSIVSVTIPKSVTSIGGSAFRGCSGLTSITIPKSVTSIGYAAFNGCSGLTSITIPNGATSIDDFTFNNCTSLTSVTIPDSVTSIGNSAFGYCSGLTSVTIGNGVTSIGSSAFYQCSSLTNVTIPNSVTNISSNAFQGCSSLASVIIPDSVTEIGGSAFENCSSLTSVTIPNNVTDIGNTAFQGCSSLTSVIIPNSVTRIGTNAFRYCTVLTSVTINATTPPIAEFGVFDGTNDCPIYVPSERVNIYKAASGWSDYASRIQAIP